MSTARVRSIEALVEFKAALCTFAAGAKEALSAAAMEIRRVENWLQEQAEYWQAGVRTCEDNVFQAKQELSRRRILRMGDRPPDCTEQEEALELARERLAHAEEKLALTAQWQRKFAEALLDYHGPINQLLGMVEADLPKADAFLEHKIAALEAYAQVAAEPK